MAQLSKMMSGLAIDGSSTPTPPSRAQPSGSSSSSQAQAHGAQGNRLPIVLKKYMNPNLTRPPNTGLATHASGSSSSSIDPARGPLLKLAGINVDSPPRSGSGKYSSPRGKGKSSIGVHTAHGLHGPAHSTAGRAMASAISSHTTHQVVVPSALKKVEKTERAEREKGDGGIGKYDGGLEADEAKREEVTGEAGRLLEMDSGSSSGCVDCAVGRSSSSDVLIHQGHSTVAACVPDRSATGQG